MSADLEEEMWFRGVEVCAWLLANCWACRKELSCRESQEVQNTLIEGVPLREKVALAIGMPPDPTPDWRCRIFEPRRRRDTDAGPSTGSAETADDAPTLELATFDVASSQPSPAAGPSKNPRPTASASPPTAPSGPGRASS